MINNGFSVESILTSVRPVQDKGLSIVFHTNEMTDEEKGKVLNFYQKFGYLIFSERLLDNEEIHSEAKHNFEDFVSMKTSEYQNKHIEDFVILDLIVKDIWDYFTQKL